MTDKAGIPKKKLRWWQIMLAVLLFGGLSLSVWMAEHPFALYQRQPMPALTLVTPEGKEFSTAEWRGAHIINIFASWCGPCKKEIPELQLLAKELPIYGIAWQDSPEKLQPWLEDNKPPFTAVGLDNGMELMRKLRVGGVPITIVVAEDGRIAYVHEGAVDLEHRKPLMRAIMDVR